MSGERFLAELDGAFQRALSSSHPLVERRIRIGGLRVALQFAGSALVRPLTRAFEHLPAYDAAVAELRVRLWDVAATGSHPPAPPWGLDRYGARGEIAHSLAGGLLATFSIESGIFLCLDPTSSTAYGWVREAGGLWPWDVAAPLRALLGWWFQTRGGQLVHGAAVGTANGAVLLAAPGGAGKSSTAVGCARAGMSYLADDYVLLRRHPGELRLWSLYQSAKLTRRCLATRFPELSPRAAAVEPDAGDAGEDDKAVLYLRDVLPQHLAECLPLRAIVVPRIATDRSTRIRRARAPEILAALAPTTLFQLPGAGAAALGFMAAVARQVPGYTMALGEPEAAIEILRELADGRPPAQ